MHKLFFLLPLVHTANVLAFPEPEFEERAVNCAAVTGALGILKVLGKPATSFCSSYLHIPRPTTAVSTATPSTTVWVIFSGRSQRLHQLTFVHNKDGVYHYCHRILSPIRMSFCTREPRGSDIRWCSPPQSRRHIGGTQRFRKTTQLSRVVFFRCKPNKLWMQLSWSSPSDHHFYYDGSYSGKSVANVVFRIARLNHHQTVNTVTTTTICQTCAPDFAQCDFSNPGLCCSQGCAAPGVLGNPYDYPACVPF